MTNLAVIMKATRRKFPAEFETMAVLILTMSLSLTAIVQEQEMPGRLEERENQLRNDQKCSGEWEAANSMNKTNLTQRIIDELNEQACKEKAQHHLRFSKRHRANRGRRQIYRGECSRSAQNCQKTLPGNHVK